VLELWHEWNSVQSFRVRIVLAEKKLDWVAHRIELLKFEHLRPEYLRLNPAGVEPTLVHDGRVITETSVICQYLDESFPQPPLLAAEPLGRAQARIWMKHFDDVVHPALRKASFELLYRPVLRQLSAGELAARLQSHPDPQRARAFTEAGSGAAVGEATTRFSEILQGIEAALERSPWLGGASFGLADVAMATFIERLGNLEMTALWQDLPRVRHWSALILARDSVARSRTPEPHRLQRSHA